MGRLQHLAPHGFSSLTGTDTPHALRTISTVQNAIERMPIHLTMDAVQPSNAQYKPRAPGLCAGVSVVSSPPPSPVNSGSKKKKENLGRPTTHRLSTSISIRFSLQVRRLALALVGSLVGRGGLRLPAGGAGAAMTGFVRASACSPLLDWIV